MSFDPTHNSKADKKKSTRFNIVRNCHEGRYSSHTRVINDDNKYMLINFLLAYKSQVYDATIAYICQARVWYPWRLII